MKDRVMKSQSKFMSVRYVPLCGTSSDAKVQRSLSPDEATGGLKNFLYPYRWLVDILGAAGTLYEGEKFQLHFKFPDDYPFKPPRVRSALRNRYCVTVC